MLPYDYLMLALVAIAALSGAWQGFVGQLGSISALVVGYLAAAQFAPAVSPHLGLEPPAAGWLAGGILFVVAWGLTRLLFQPLAARVTRHGFGAHDRWAGALVGTGKGVVACLVVTWLALDVAAAGGPRWVADSRSGRCLAAVIEMATNGAPMTEEPGRDTPRAGGPLELIRSRVGEALPGASADVAELLVRP